MSNTYKHKRRGKNNRMWIKYSKGEITREEVKDSDPELWFSWIDYVPSDWNNLYHERPYRRENKNLIKNVIKDYNSGDDLEDYSFRSNYKKPHIYYW